MSDNHAARRRVAAAERRIGRKLAKRLAEFERMSGGIIEGEIVRRGDAPCEQLWGAHAAMATAWPQLRRLPAAHVHRDRGRA